MRLRGYLALRAYGLLGDGQSSALVGRDGAVDWICVRRFAPPISCELRDTSRADSPRPPPNGA